MRQMGESAEWYRLALGTLCVWRVSHLLHAEDGPWDVLAALRRAVGHGMAGRMLDCFHCVSVWVAVPFAVLLGGGAGECLLLVPALSAAAILAERATSRPGAAVSAWYHEQEPKDVVLWKEADGGGRGAGDAARE
jgi:hypothetical protein